MRYRTIFVLISMAACSAQPVRGPVGSDEEDEPSADEHAEGSAKIEWAGRPISFKPVDAGVETASPLEDGTVPYQGDPAGWLADAYGAEMTPERLAELEALQAEVRRWSEDFIGNFPFELTEVPSDMSLSHRSELADRTGEVAVVLGSRDDLGQLAEGLVPFPGTPDELLPAPTSVLLERSRSLIWPTDYAAHLDEQAARFGLTDGDAAGPPEGPWPEGRLEAEPDPLDGLSGEAVYLATFPTGDPAEVPAYLRYGAWNAYPPPEYHVAALRSWHERYGAELVALTSDTVILRVARPVTDREEALALAREMYLYCPDSVEQGAGTVQNLAASLIGRGIWVFWWD